MNKPSYITLLFLILASVLTFNACDKSEDYSHIIYKNYLSYEINRAEAFLGTTVEGSNEGEYKSGSKQTYQDKIDQSMLVDENKCF